MRDNVKKYNATIYACFIGYITQAIVNNFIPLLFVTFQTTYNIPLSQIGLLVTVNFGVQLLVDALSIYWADKIGYRPLIVTAHICCGLGLISLAILPELLNRPLFGILIGVTIYAVGGGLIEVLISPIVEACPTKRKAAMMSLLHSFYCWGHVGVVLLSTLFFAVAGIQNWKWLAIVWAIIPLVNAMVFIKVPILSISEQEERIPFRKIVLSKQFWVLVLLMICAAASEQGVSQWASTFAEEGLGVSKAIGDLSGPMLFAILMGTSRLLYGKFESKINLEKYMFASSILCIVSYLLIALSPWPVVSLLGCGLCGFSVGIMWPGSFSIAAKTMRRGGTALFAMLALAGDLGCGGGPAMIGYVSELFSNRLKIGMLFGVLFPFFLIIGLMINRHITRISVDFSPDV